MSKTLTRARGWEIINNNNDNIYILGLCIISAKIPHEEIISTSNHSCSYEEKLWNVVQHIELESTCWD